MILEATRRAIGMIIPGLLLAMIGYIYISPYLGGVWQMRGLSWDLLVNSIYYSPLGIYGSVTGMSATFIAMFVIFGALLSVTGAGKTFIDIALALTGKFTGGPAKTAVIASAMFGSISGSAVANVMVTGNYTIPMMKKSGYEPNFAGAVEAISSTGGGITPPIMSITAFMMAEFLDMSYLKIIGYALIPCLLYYTGFLPGVHFQTVRKGPQRTAQGGDSPLAGHPDLSQDGRLPGPLGHSPVHDLLQGNPCSKRVFTPALRPSWSIFLLNLRTQGFGRLVSDLVKALSSGRARHRCASSRSWFR